MIINSLPPGKQKLRSSPMSLGTIVEMPVEQECGFSSGMLFPLILKEG